MRYLWGIIGSLLMLSGCGSDDPVKPPPPPSAAVQVTELFSGEALPGVKIVAMNAANNTILDSPRLTDATGDITFDFTPNQDTRYLVFGGLDWIVHRQADWTTASIPTQIILRPARAQDGLPRIAGKVVDAITGATLSQVFIGATPQLIAYNGDTDPGTDLTGPDGTFLVQEIAFAVHPITGNLSQVDLLFVSHLGYRPRTWVYHHANGDNNLDIRGVEIALTPLGATDTSRLVGRILLNGLPAADVPVGLGGLSTAKSGFGLPGQVVRTDGNGRYAFTNLAAGFYVVHPGFSLGDGFYFPAQERPPSFRVLAGETTEATDQAVVREIRPELGDNSTASRTNGNLLLSWSSVPETFEYQLSIDRRVVQSSIQNHLVWEIPTEMANGWHNWRVLAITESHNLLGAMQKESWWQLTD